ncbi:MAG: hypothetical protein R2751_17915 [Bacteroidales bacterium]
MTKKFRVLVLFVLVLLPLNSQAQMLWRILRYEGGVGLGSVQPFTDIGPASNEFSNFFNGTRPNLTLDFRYKLDPMVALKLDLGYVWIGGRDVASDNHARPIPGTLGNADFLYAFGTHAFEHTIRLELYALGDGRFRTSGAIYNRKGMLNDFNTLYVYGFIGAGGVLHKSKVYEAGNRGNDLSGQVEGVNTNLLWTPVIPIGIGVKYSISSKWTVGGEIGYRYFMGDFLDGYSDSYFSEYDDYYYLLSAKILYRIRAGRSGLPTFKKYLY